MNAKLVICYLRLLIALLLWAGTLFVVRRMVACANIYVIADFRYTISATILLIWHRLQRGRFFPRLSIKQWFSIFLVSLFGIIIYNIFFLSAMKMISGSIYAMIFALVPTITTTIAIFVFRIKYNNYTILGIFISFIATVMLISVIAPECGQFFCTRLFRHGLGVGELLAFLATLSFSLFAICNSYAGKLGVHSLELNVYSSVFGAIALFMISMNHITIPDLLHATALPFKFWVDMFYITVLATVLAYIWYTQAILKIGVAATSILQNTMPLQSVMIGYFFMGDVITVREVIAGILVVIGVYVTHFSLHYAKTAK